MLGRRQDIGRGRGGSSGGGGAAPSASSSLSIGSSNTDSDLAEKAKGLLRRVGVMKAEPPPLTVQQQQTIARLEQENKRLENQDKAIKHMIQAELVANPKIKPEAKFPTQMVQLKQSMIVRARNTKLIQTILAQRMHIQQAQSRADVLPVLQRGNTALAEENKKADASIDVGGLADDTSELFAESVESQTEFFTDISSIDLGGGSGFDDIELSLDTGETGTLGDVLGAEIEAMRASAFQVQDAEALAVKEELQDVVMPASSAPGPRRATARPGGPPGGGGDSWAGTPAAAAPRRHAAAVLADGGSVSYAPTASPSLLLDAPRPLASGGRPRTAAAPFVASQHQSLYDDEFDFLK
jgi:hypothetical protein